MKKRIISLSFLISLLFSITACNKKEEQDNKGEEIDDLPFRLDYRGTVSNNDYFCDGFSLQTGNVLFLAVTANDAANYHFYFPFNVAVQDLESANISEVFVCLYKDPYFTNFKYDAETIIQTNYKIEEANDYYDYFAVVFDKTLEKNETLYFAVAFGNFEERQYPPITIRVYFEITSGDFPFSPYLIPIQ